MKLDFTTVKYKDFLIYLKKSNIPVFTIKDWITKQPKNGIILRHDVDRNPNQAIKIAEIASELNIKGTFNFPIQKISNIFTDHGPIPKTDKSSL